MRELRHPHVVELIDAFVDNGHVFLVLELLSRWCQSPTFLKYGTYLNSTLMNSMASCLNVGISNSHVTRANMHHKEKNKISLFEFHFYSFFLLLAICSTDLEGLIRNARERNTALMAGQIKSLMQMLFRGLSFLHRHWILHRDLKPGHNGEFLSYHASFFKCIERHRFSWKSSPLFFIT